MTGSADRKLFKPPVEVGEAGKGVYCVDLFEGGHPDRTCAYIVKDGGRAAIVETGAAPLSWRVLKSLETLGLSADAVEWIVLTHIHLDHGGGAGWLMENLPNAKVGVHPRGGRHLVDPSRLIAGARAVYGDRFDSMFAPIVPIPADRVVEVPDGGTVAMSTGRTFEIIHLAGHARHHFVAVDRTSDGVFTGDNAGVRYPWLSRYGFTPALPTTSPSEFDPPELEKTMDRLVNLGVKNYYFTHFSCGTAAEVRECRNWIAGYVKLVKETGADWEKLRGRFRQEITEALVRRGVPAGAPELKSLELDHEINAKGVALWWEKAGGING